MSGPEQPDHRMWEVDTVPTPRVRTEPPTPPPVRPTSPPPVRSSSDTLEMPALRNGGRAAGRGPDARPPRARGAGGPARSSRRVPGAGPGRRRLPGRGKAAALAGALVVAAGAGVLAGRLVPPAGEEPPLAVAAGAGDAALDVTWTSVDPVGGSGFRQVDASTWRTQSYRTAEFGNLKDGVGLLADLGEPREVEAVTVDVAPVGAVVELRAGDAPSQDPQDYTVVDRAGEAGGPTTLEAGDAGAHRYWLLWVPQLGPREGGYVAELSEPDVEA